MEPGRGNAAYDSAAAFAPILLILATCLTVFHRLRVRWPVRVNCWFCNENTKISRRHLGWWLCPWCEQYNGFSKNGDYSRDIPEQYATPSMSTRYCRLSEASDDRRARRSKLCECCNKREALKLSELSGFEPKNERHFDAELKAFKEYLEVRYPLCDGCKLTVRDVLHKQAVWLTHYKMLFFRQKPIRMLVDNARKLETIFRAASIILASTLVYNQDCIWLPVGGLFLHLCAYWTSSTRNKNSDMLLIFLWLCVIILMSVKSLMILQNAWLISEYIAQYHMIEMCAFITTSTSLRSCMYKNTLTGSVAFKKIKLRPYDTASPQFACNGQSGNGTVPSETNDSIKLSDELSFTEIKFSKSHSAILRQKLSTITANEGNGYVNSVSPNESGSFDNYCLNDSLSTLLLSEEPARCNRKAAPAVFERRVYSATSSENLFRRSGGAYGKRRCVLSPPKLRSVTQTSWVAGGYWQEGMMTATPATLSRSSSQSSGFGSVGSSNLASSREPSVHEFDRCSVVSEATRWSCQTPRPGLVARHDSPIPRPQSRYSDATGGHSRVVPSPTICAIRYADDHQVQETCVHGPPSVGGRNGSTPAYAGHHTTIVASPGWLSALLCGSLILNMIVLCTTLLR